MTPNSGQRATTFWHLGRGIVWAAGTEVWNSFQRRDDLRQPCLGSLDKGDAFFNCGAGMKTTNPAGDYLGYLAGR